MPVARIVPKKGPSCDGPFRAAFDGHRRDEVLGTRRFLTYSAAAAAQYHMHMYNPKPWIYPPNPSPFWAPFLNPNPPIWGPIWADPGRGGRQKLSEISALITLSLRGRFGLPSAKRAELPITKGVRRLGAFPGAYNGAGCEEFWAIMSRFRSFRVAILPRAFLTAETAGCQKVTKHFNATPS